MNFKYNQHASHLKENDWLIGSKYLDPYILYLKKTSKELGFKLKISSVWPRIEISSSHFGFSKIMRFELNPNYLIDGLVSFHCYALKYKKNIIFKNELVYKEDFFILSKNDMSDFTSSLKKVNDYAIKLNEL